jgi:hypothetical protein
MQYKVVVINGVGKRSDGSVVQCRLDVGNIALARSSVAVCTIHTELSRNMSAHGGMTGIMEGISHVDDNIHVEAGLVSRSTSSHEVVDSRVGRDNLVVIGSCSIKPRQCH